MTAVDESRAPAAAPARQDRGGGAWRVAMALARFEGVRLVRHPTTVFGVVLSSVLAVSFLAPVRPVLQREVLVLCVLASPVAAGVSFAAALAASRARRDGTLPLATAAASSALARTCGLLLALLWPAAAVTVWMGTALVVLALAGGIGTPSAADLLAPAGTVLLLGAFGVALGRWVPSATAAAFALPVVVVGLAVNVAAFESTTRERLLPWSDWGGLRPGLLVEAWPRQPWVHLLYVLCAAAAFCGLAALRDRRTPRVAAATVAAVLATTAVAAHLLAVWDDESRVADLVRVLRDPSANLDCMPGDSAEVCVPPGYGPWAAMLRVPAEEALAVVPEDHRLPGLRVELLSRGQRDLVSSLPPATVASLPRDVAVPADPLWTWWDPPTPGVVPALASQQRGAAGRYQRLDLVLGVLAEATGFRDTAERRLRDLFADVGPGAEVEAATREPRPLGVVDGCAPLLEAREVLTFALAAASGSASEAALRERMEQEPYGWVVSEGLTEFVDWFSLPGGAVTDGSGVFAYGQTGPWSRGAAVLGLELAERTEVADLWADWDRWTDPATSADEIVEAFDLTPLPSPAALAGGIGVADDGFHPDCP